MISPHLRRWLVAIVMVVGVAVGGGARPGPLTAPEAGSAGRIAATVSAWSGAEGMMPAKLLAGPAAPHERSAHVRILLPAAVLLATGLAAAMLRQVVRRPDRPRTPLLRRVRSLRRRAPPHLSPG